MQLISIILFLSTFCHVICHFFAHKHRHTHTHSATFNVVYILIVMVILCKNIQSPFSTNNRSSVVCCMLSWAHAFTSNPTHLYTLEGGGAAQSHHHHGNETEERRDLIFLHIAPQLFLEGGNIYLLQQSICIHARCICCTFILLV